jgi:sulfofructose kinase
VLFFLRHLQEFHEHGVDTSCVVRGDAPTPLSAVLVKPNGDRALVNYKGNTQALTADRIRLPNPMPKTLLFDGHEPPVSVALVAQARQAGIPTVLDAGSVHEGTLALMDKVDYLVCSEKFAKHWARDAQTALHVLAERAAVAVITLSERGLLWQRGNDRGAMAAFPVAAIDSTGAGDAFHGAFAAGVAANLPWLELLRYASAAGALCCTKMGARTGMPDSVEHQALLANVSYTASLYK